MNRSIILTGLSGSGKTSAGISLAQMLNCPFLDTDHLIEQRVGQPVSTIFQEKGELFFRQAETKTLEKLLEESKANMRAVISTGGGIVIEERNRLLLRQLGKVVFLSAPVSVLADRLSGDATRPLLQAFAKRGKTADHKFSQGESLERRLDEMWISRREAYLQADFTIDTAQMNALEVAKKVYLLLGLVRK